MMRFSFHGNAMRANRLIHETSPYLLQHAHNPVDWHPWTEAAFARARSEDKPVLLSIGYSACHWCHVMAHESFEDDEIAALMNARFVNIKVDREERPDLDLIYQNAVQLFIRRGGGWPLTMFLTPDKVPFYGGTYFPPSDRHGLPCFPKILEMLADAYRDRKEDIARTTSEAQNALVQMSHRTPDPTLQEIAPDLLTQSAEGLSRIFDATHGGFGNAPKFPQTPALHLLLRAHSLSGEAAYLAMVTQTLGKMAWGGIYDHLGGGFHRYSTDRHWLVPHFEKMLYDNAQLAPLYFAVFQATGQTFYRDIGEEILEYVLREMTDKEGGFYSTQDADTEGHEGTTYVWTMAEIHEALGDEAGRLFCRYYGVTPGGNFEGANILHVSRPISDLSKESGKPVPEIEALLRAGRQTLLARRMQRPQPFRDEKVLTSWNSLMISAFVAGYQVTRKTHYLAAAQRAAAFVMENLCKEGRLLRTWKDGVAKLNGYLDDQALSIQALIALYEATGTVEYLHDAQRIATRMIADYGDTADGGFFFTSSDHEALITREKPVYDQSVPSGNAAAAQALLHLFHLTGEPVYEEAARGTLLAFSPMMDNPTGCGQMILAADLYLRRPIEIVLISPDLPALSAPAAPAREIETWLTALHRLYLPNKVIHLVPSDRADAADLPAPVRGKRRVEGQATVYVCKNFTCSPPLTDWDAIQEQLLPLQV
jgi:uncharacterized protein YyaL (SSP411 family)